MSFDQTTLNKLFERSKFSETQREDYLKTLNAQLQHDNHDLALDEKLEIITTCFDRCVNSVILAIPSNEEMQRFQICVRKFSRVKMRSIQYYHQHLHRDHSDSQTYLQKNLQTLKVFLPAPAAEHKHALNDLQ